MYIKVINDIIEYPYSIQQLKNDNPNTSFPDILDNESLSLWNVFPVIRTDKPIVNYNQDIEEGIPKKVNNQWEQVWEVTSASNEETLQRILNLRAAEYPPMADYLDGIVKSDQAQIDKYIADCLAVKAKYPKP